jgi:hypothetical protein
MTHRNGNGAVNAIYGGDQYAGEVYGSQTFPENTQPPQYDEPYQPPKVMRDYAVEQQAKANDFWAGQASQFELEVKDELERVAKMLVDKNRAYGDSALNPLRVFSQADAIEQILVRIDDKLSRIRNGQAYPGDDDTFDLIGYLILYRLKMYEKLRGQQ